MSPRFIEETDRLQTVQVSFKRLQQPLGTFCVAPYSPTSHTPLYADMRLLSGATPLLGSLLTQNAAKGCDLLS